MPALLGVNIDHVATIRQARYRDQAEHGVFGEPDPVLAAHEAELGGADIITAHLREDRRHLQDRDLELLARTSRVRLNLEMAATDAMVEITRRTRGQVQNLWLRRPEMITLVPEGRQEVTTEGGLDVAGQLSRLSVIVRTLKGLEGGAVVSAFIDCDDRQVEAAAKAGFDACEFHTGPYAAAFAVTGGDDRLKGRDGRSIADHLAMLRDAGHRTRALGMRFHAGHALNYANVGPVARLAGITELHIGHSIVSRAAYVGLRQAVADMKALIGR
ncbi:MAG: pyridoxine 5'-phosphate synthase [Phycisphaerales bacterium]